MTTFTRAEYSRRVDRAKAEMRRRGIDVLVCSDPSNMNYLSGYDGWSFYVHQMVVLALDADEPVWIGRAMDAPGARLTTFLGTDDIIPYPEDYVDSPERHPMEFAAGIFADQGWGRLRIGVEMDSFYFTAQACDTLRRALPDADLVDAFGLVNWLRIVKSTAEIELIRAGAAIVGHAMATGINVIEPGVRECDAVATILAAQISGTDGHWGDYPAAVPQAPTGVKTAAPHLTWSGDRYKSDSVTYLELAGCHNRYHAALARTIYLGRPPQRLLDLAAVVEDGLDAVLATAEAGRTCEEVEAAWRAVIAKARYSKASRIGYSIGLGYPPDWGERTASLRPGDRTVMAADMCFHVILGMWADDWGYELSETVRITVQGPPEVLTDFPRKLVIKD